MMRQEIPPSHQVAIAMKANTGKGFRRALIRLVIRMVIDMRVG